MAEFLTTTGISSALEDIIRNAKDRLILISPYLQINDRLKELLEEKDRFNRELPEDKEQSILGVLFSDPTPKPIDVYVVYGKNEKPEEKDWLESLTSVEPRFRKNLHAKCYLNEDKALLTSMNLYAFSQVNNDEMGLLVRRKDEPELYDRILEESMRLASRREATGQPKAKKPRTSVDVPDTGFCIRCGDTIPANAGRPYCYPHFKSWNRSKDENSKEKRCHICGKGHNKATKRKPAHLACYRKYESWVDSTKK